MEEIEIIRRARARRGDMERTYEIANDEYYYVYHVCRAVRSCDTEKEDSTTAVYPHSVRYIAVRRDATVIARCPYCGERVA